VRLLQAAAAAGAALLLACGAAEGTPRVVTYVALGDSTGFGVTDGPNLGVADGGGYPPRLARRMREAGREVELVNLSVPGATARSLADVQVPLALPVRAELVTVGVGANDVGSARTADELAADFEEIFARLATLGAPVIAANVPDLTLTRGGADAAGVARVNQAIAAAAARHGVAVVDLFAASRDRLLARPELLGPDGFHPSAAGYEEWAEIMWPAVRAAVGIR
jgi:lysophospholipase L1-like esterase